MRDGPCYASSLRIGFIVPSANTCAEPELAALAPPGVGCFATRLPLRATDAADLHSMTTDVEVASALLRDLAPSLIVFHCTGASAIHGQGLVQRIVDVAACPAATTADSIVEALRAADSRRPALVGPYPREIADGEGRFFTRSGFELSSNVALDLPISTWATLDAEYWVEAARNATAPDSDAVVISCTNLRSAGAIQRLEDELGLPVVTSNQAAMWQALRLLGFEEPVLGYGSLLAHRALRPVSA